MTDARLPGTWLHQPAYWELSDRAWRLLSGALMWSAQAGTDGKIGPAYLPMICPGGVDDAAAEELVDRGHWVRTSDGGFQVIDWSGEKGQSTAAEVEAYRARKRRTQAAYRARMVAVKKAAATPPQPAGSTGDVVASVTGHVGPARPGSVPRTDEPPKAGGSPRPRRAPTARAAAPPDVLSPAENRPAARPVAPRVAPRLADGRLAPPPPPSPETAFGRAADARAEAKARVALRVIPGWTPPRNPDARPQLELNLWLEALPAPPADALEGLAPELTSATA